MQDKNLTVCRICGLNHGYAIWGDDGKSPTHDICDCCGTEFGYEDCQLSAIRKNRQKWIEGGAKWYNENQKPENWNLEDSLRNIPEEFK